MKYFIQSTIIYFHSKGRRRYNIFPYGLGKWELKAGVTRLQCSYRRVLKALGKRRAKKDTTAFYRYGRWLKWEGRAISAKGEYKNK